jgi:O-antigen/teichoic acid export membrane protein
LREHIRKLGGQSLLYGLPEILNNAVTILLIPLYTSYLTTADFGILGLMVSVAMLLSHLYKLGLHQGLLKHYFDFERPEDRKKYIGTVTVFILGYNLAITGIVTLLGVTVFRYPLAAVPFHPYFITVFWAMCFSGLDFIVMTRFRVMDMPVKHFILSLCRFAVSTSLTIILIVKFGQGAMGRLNSMLFTSVAFFIVSLVLLRDVDFRPHWAYLKKALAFSMPLVPYFLTTWLLSCSDRWILTFYRGLDEVGLYNLGHRIASIMQFLTVVLSLSLVPHFYSLAKQGRRRELDRLAGYYAVVMIIVALGIAAFGGAAIHTLASRPFHAAAGVVPLLTLAFLFQALYVFPTCAVNVREKTWVMSALAAAGTVINLALNFLLIPRYGMYGAAAATAITLVLMWLFLHTFAQKHYPLRYNYVIMGASALIALALYFAQTFLPPLASPLLTTLVRLGIVALGIVVLLLLMYFSHRREKRPEGPPTTHKHGSE